MKKLILKLGARLSNFRATSSGQRDVWEDEGSSHGCTVGQAYQYRTHQHADGRLYVEQCQPMGGSTWNWNVV